MVLAWLITLPMAGFAGAVTWYVGKACGGGAVGALAMVAVLVALSAYMVHRSRREPINHDNVNDAWNGPSAVVTPAEPVAA
jgi:PiT family inorganic phosphate transporter